MMAITHAIISSAGASLILGKTDTLTLGLAILGSQLPDLDTSTSLIGQCCFPLSRWLEKRFPHRTITHSLLATIILSAVSLISGYYFFNDLLYFMALPIGHILSCFSDTFTKQGVQFFYPSNSWCISVSNPHRRIRTGSTSEYYVLAVFSLILFLNFSIISNTGSISNAISLNLGLRNDIVKVYNADANTHLFTATIKGYYSGDRSVINNEEFTVIGNEGTEFYLEKEGNIYKTGENIIVEKLDIKKSKTILSKVERIVFDDEDFGKRLVYLSGNRDTETDNSVTGNSLIYLSGKVVIDYPEEVSNPDILGQYPYFSLNNNTVTLSYCPVDIAVNLLQNQYAIGEVQAKIIKLQ